MNASLSLTRLLAIHSLDKIKFVNMSTTYTQAAINSKSYFKRLCLFDAISP